MFDGAKLAFCVAVGSAGWLRYYDKPPERTLRAKVIQSWDTAAKDGAQNDWSVCTTWLLLDKHFYLLDLVRGRYEYLSLLKFPQG